MQWWCVRNDVVDGVLLMGMPGNIMMGSMVARGFGKKRGMQAPRVPPSQYQSGSHLPEIAALIAFVGLYLGTKSIVIAFGGGIILYFLAGLAKKKNVQPMPPENVEPTPAR